MKTRDGAKGQPQECEGRGWDRASADYDVLATEMWAALASKAARTAGQEIGAVYDDLFEQAMRFAPALKAVLAANREATIMVENGVQLSFASYASVLGRTDCAAAVDESLSDPACAERRARSFIDAGRRSPEARGNDVFAAFTGRWTGGWYTREVTAQGRNLARNAALFGEIRRVGSFDHLWSPTQEHGAIEVQAVLMGPLDEKRSRPSPTGIDTTDPKGPTAAVNAVDPRTGRITGAVGVSLGRAERPHVGYFVDPSTLIWVAKESPPDLYSCFFEHRGCEGKYLILGVQFTHVNGIFRLTQLMGGQYENPLVNSELLPSHAGMAVAVVAGPSVR